MDKKQEVSLFIWRHQIDCRMRFKISRGKKQKMKSIGLISILMGWQGELMDDSTVSRSFGFGDRQKIISNLCLPIILSSRNKSILQCAIT